MKKTFIYIIAILSCLFITGCSSAGGISTFTMAVEKMPENFDPRLATGKEDLAVITNIFDGLFEIKDGQVVNNLAESYHISPDGKTHTITIKTDSVYHCKGKHKEEFEGTEVKAKDFVFAINRILDSRTRSPYYDDFSNIASVSATDDYSIKIVLKNADFNFDEKLAMSAVFPCNENFFNKTGGAYGLTLDNILSNGPFRLNYLDIEGGNGTLVSTDENSGKLQRIRLKKVETDKQSESYKNDEISGFFSHNLQNEHYESTKQINFDSGNISLMFNLSKDNFANENIRQAFSWYCFGFKNSGANPAAVSPASSIFPDTLTIAGQHVNDIITPQPPVYLENDPKIILQQGLGQTGASKIKPATVLIPNDSTFTVIYENINQLWQKNLGRFFTVEYLPTSQIKQLVEKGNFDIAFVPMSPQNNTTYGILQLFTAFDGTLNETVNTAKSMSDQKNSISHIQTAQDIIIQKAMVAPMGSQQSAFYYRDYFENIYVDPFTNVINLKNVTVK